MTKSEEERIFTGPSPWKKAGFIVAHPGMVARHLAPKISTFDSGAPQVERPRKAEREFFSGFHEMKSQLEQRSEDISRAGLKMRREEIREQLASEWEQLQKLGQRAESEYMEFKDQVANRLERAGADDSESSSQNFGPQAICREGSLASYPKWTYIWRKSHLAFSRFLDETASAFNLLAGKYKLLREKRRESTLSKPEQLPDPGKPDEPNKEYDPEPQVHQYDPCTEVENIFQDIVDLVREKEDLLDTDYKFDILRLVHDRLYDSEETNPNLINTKICNDMKERKGMEEIYPETPQDLIKLARRHPSTACSSTE
jgi:hypothetical protein